MCAVSFWEKRLCRACLGGWVAWAARLHLAGRRCVGLRARGALRRHWLAYRVRFNERRLDRHKRIAALAHWGLRTAHSVFGAWRRAHRVEIIARWQGRTGTLHRGLRRLGRAAAAAAEAEAQLAAAEAWWRGAHLGRGWRAWLHRAARTADCRRKALLLGARHAGGVRRAVLAAWRQHCAARARARWSGLEVCRLSRLRGLLARLLAFAAASQSARRRAALLLTSREARLLLGVVRAWCHLLRRTRDERAKVRGALGRMRHRELATSVLQWLSYVDGQVGLSSPLTSRHLP